uniref:Putative salivary lipocalin n=1 Tax=Ixodes ricinus TaxID=34613 RepID=A0A0K8RMH7_IXORI
MRVAAFLVSICFWFLRHTTAYPETRIDDDPYYEEYQDINRALQNSDSFSWMYNRTYLPKIGDPEYACVYADVTRLPNPGAYVFKQGWTTAENKTIEVPLFVSTKSTPGNGYIRQKDNAMHVTLRLQNGTILRDFGLYKLIYSDYKWCDILRVTSRGNACELYVHKAHVDRGVPKACKSIYRHACGRQDNYHYKVYYENCRTHQKIN